jgi:hypothetical protein
MDVDRRWDIGPEEDAVNHSLRSADATTHLKVVCVSLIASIIVVVAALAAHATPVSIVWSAS